MGEAGPVKPGRKRDRDKALAILDAGWRLFLDRGVEATSIESVAAAAGVSKVTLYSHYPDKAALFEAAVRREMEQIERAQQPEDGAPMPVADRLRRFGLGLFGFLTSKPAVDFYSVVAGELRRHDALAAAFYALGPGRTRRNLAAIIAAAARDGELAATDPERAAEQLFGLWQGFSNFQLALGIDIDAIRTGLPDRIEQGVAAFLALHGTGSAPSTDD